MAYRRSARKISARRRARRALSNYKIATRTSAKSQAKQIYALKKRINYIQRRTKPEILIARRVGNGIINFTANATGVFEWNGATVNFVPPLGTQSSDLNLTGASSPPSDFARLLSFTLYGNFYYTELPNDQNGPVRLRIVIAQTKATRAAPPEDNDVFSRGNAGSAVYGPLQTGLARTLKVLSDRHYTLSYQYPNVVIKTPLRYLLPFYRDSNSAGSASGSESWGKGAIYVFYAVYGATFTNCSLSLEGKLAYTDA